MGFGAARALPASSIERMVYVYMVNTFQSRRLRMMQYVWV